MTPASLPHHINDLSFRPEAALFAAAAEKPATLSHKSGYPIFGASFALKVGIAQSATAPAHSLIATACCCRP